MKKNEIKFEDKMNRLAEIVREIDSGNLALEESLKLYEEANALIKDLKETIEKAKEKVEKEANSN